MARVEWTVEQAIEEQRLWSQQNSGKDDLRSSPLFQWTALQDLAAHEDRFNKGDRSAVFAALYVCAVNDVPIPQWAASAFISGYQSVLNCRSASWDEAFGQPFPKGFRIHDARRRREQWPLIVPTVVKAVLEEGTPIDAGLFEQVGERLGIGARQVRETWYGAEGGLGRAQVKSVKERWAAATRRAGKPTSR